MKSLLEFIKIGIGWRRWYGRAKRDLDLSLISVDPYIGRPRSGNIPAWYCWTMRIVSLPASIVVLLLTTVLSFVSVAELNTTPGPNQFDTNSKEVSPNFDVSGEDSSSSAEVRNYSSHQWLTVSQVEKLLFLEGGANHSVPVDCCPSLTEMTIPEAGINVRGEIVQLYKLGEIRQQFHEVSCREGIASQPCRFMQKPFHNRSRCVQKYSYSYALVAHPNQTTTNGQHLKQFTGSFNNATDRYMLDHIQIRSGCSCEITPPRVDSLRPKTSWKTSRLKYKKNKLSEKT